MSYQSIVRVLELTGAEFTFTSVNDKPGRFTDTLSIKMPHKDVVHIVVERRESLLDREPYKEPDFLVIDSGGFDNDDAIDMVTKLDWSDHES